MRLLDLYSCQGGAGVGYTRAGFDVTGVDIEPQPMYPLRFVQADALQYLSDHWQEYDVIHASPPCQKFSEMQRMHNNRDEHPDLIEPTRQALMQTGKPWIIENVEGAPLRTYFMLCGTMFGLPITKHRLFETSWPMPVLMPPCDHRGVYDRFHGGEQARDEKTKHAAAQGIDWPMDRYGARQAIPPAYTTFIGRHLMAALGRAETAT